MPDETPQPSAAERMFPSMPGNNQKPADTNARNDGEDVKTQAQRMFGDGEEPEDGENSGRNFGKEARENAENADRMTDAERSEAAEALGKELTDADFDVSTESATSFLDFAAEKKLTKDDAAQLAELADKRGAEQWQTLSDQWREESQKLDGFDTLVADGVSVVKQFGDDDFVQLLDTYHVGNHPAVVRFLGKVGAALKGAKL